MGRRKKEQTVDPNRHVVDSRLLYTKHALAWILGNGDLKWVERYIMYPQHPTTRKPLCECAECSAEFSFPTEDDARCPECGSSKIGMVQGCAYRKLGGEVVFSGRHLLEWVEKRAKSRTRKSWNEYARKTQENSGT